MALAHRVAFALSRGRVAQENVLHTCDVRLCVEPSHLFEGTQKQNIRQAVARGRHICGYGLHQKRAAAARRTGAMNPG